MKAQQARVCRILTISTLSLVISMAFAPRAHASKARLQSLSQSVNGSLFINDNRDIFLNPATINEVAGGANFEWGAKPSPSASPSAEGGAIYKTDMLNYGLQIGRIGDATQEMATATSLVLTGGKTYFYPQNSLDAIVGAAAGALKWGAGVHYARSQYDTGATVNFPKKKARDLQLLGGAILGQMRGYAKIDVIHESTTDDVGGSTLSYTGKPSAELGGKFALDDLQAVGVIVSRRAFGFDNASGTQGDVIDLRARADYFRLLVSKAGTTLFALAGVSYATVDVGYTTVGVQSAKYMSLTSPVGLGVEHRALSWLTLRASVTQNILLDQDKRTNGTSDYESANLEDTTVAAGLSAHLNENMQIDATFKGADSTTGELNGTQLAANVSFLYNF